MIREALQYLTGLALESQKPVEVPTGDPAERIYLFGKEVVKVALPEPFRKHTAGQVDSLIEVAARFQEDAPVVWVSEDSVVVVLDDEGHRAHLTTLPLVKSDLFDRLFKLADEPEWLDQKAFIRLLRVDLAGTLPPGVLLDKVRKLSFENSSVVSGSVARDRESMGRSLTSQVKADSELPETVTIVAPVFQLDAPYPIVCAVDVDAARGLLQLLPLPDEIERAKRSAINGLIDRLQKSLAETTHVYHGKP